MEHPNLASASTDKLTFSESAYTDADEALNDPEMEELMGEITLKAKAMGRKQEERNVTQERIAEMWNRISEGIREDLEGRKEIRERIEKLQEHINDVQDGMRDVQEGIRDVLDAINGESKARNQTDRKVPIGRRSNYSMQAKPSGIRETHGQVKPEGAGRAAAEETLYIVADDSAPAFEAKAQPPPRARANSV